MVQEGAHLRYNL
ncbi:unnamed protein product, partial [Allacma fusca]